MGLWGAYQPAGASELSGYLLRDPGASLAAAIMANHGAIANRDFAFPYGPLTLALQQIAQWLWKFGPGAMTALQYSAALVFAWAAWKMIHRWDLEFPNLIILATLVYMVTIMSWPPIYELEPAVIIWVLLAQARARPAWACMLCAVGVLIKPSMSYVLGAIILVEWIAREKPWKMRRDLFFILLLPLLLSAGLVLHFGWPGFWSMVSPWVGARNYYALHYSFFSTTYNPWLIPGMRVGYFLGTPVLAWTFSLLLLLVVVATTLWREKTVSPRLSVAITCCIASLVFIAFFYGPPPSYIYYLSLPAIGIALVPLPGRGKSLVALAAILLVIGNFSATRNDWNMWRQERVSTATADLWAQPAIAAEWTTLWALRARSRLSFIGTGSPRVIFPQFGLPWHAYLVPGEATLREREILSDRLQSSRCVAIAPDFRLNHPPAALAAIRAHAPLIQARLYDLYCHLK